MSIEQRINLAVVKARRQLRVIKSIHLGEAEVAELDTLPNAGELFETPSFDIVAKKVKKPKYFRVYCSY